MKLGNKGVHVIYFLNQKRAWHFLLRKDYKQRLCFYTFYFSYRNNKDSHPIYFNK